MRTKIFIDNCEYVESRTVCGYKLFIELIKTTMIFTARVIFLNMKMTK